jgi:very-short-patch-repair endonuclease
VGGAVSSTGGPAGASTSGSVASSPGRAPDRGRCSLMTSTHPDTRILEIAARQHGVVSRRQLREAGLSRGAIEHRLRKGTLGPVHRGVYRTGPTTPKYQAEAAALLACGDAAVLTHRTAAGILRIIPERRPEEPVDVSGPRTLRGPRSGVRIHRVERLPADEVERRHGLAVATAPRTILDLAACLGPYDLERALARAERQELVTLDQIRAVAERYRGRPGRGRLQALLDDIGEPALTRSPPELLLLKKLRKAGVPQPRTNARIAGMEVDLLFPDYRLAVEIDGYAFHRQRPAFEDDRSRGAALAAHGITVMRFTWRQITRESDKVLARLCLALGARTPKR